MPTRPAIVMWNIGLIVLASCGKSHDTLPNQVTMDVKEAKSAAKEIPYKSELENGLALQFNCLHVPRGRIQNMGGLSSEIESADRKNLRFPVSYLQFLEACRKEGLIELIEQTQSALDMVGNLGTRMFNVTWTPKALGIRDEAKSDEAWLCIPFGSCRIKTIVKDIEYHSSKLPQSDDFRLIVGTYERTYNDFGKTIFPLGKNGVFKFRAVIKLNPFNQTYSCETADWGTIEGDGWKTENIAE